MTKYFLILNTANLVHYFSKGLIVPNVLIEGWIDDFQSKIKNALILTDNLIVNQSTCALELVVLSEEEKFVSDIANNFFLYTGALPVTRVQNIYFNTSQQAQQTILNIQSSDAFIPKKLIKVNKENRDIDLNNIEFKYGLDFDSELKVKSDLYDKLLGGFALMKLGADEDYKEFSNNYFKYLSFFNKYVESETKDLGINFDSRNFKAIRLENNKDLPYIYRPVNHDVVQKLSNEDIPKTRFGSFDLDRIKGFREYGLAILATYGNDHGKIKKIDDFISKILNGGIKEDWLEQICLFFGINQGYHAFRNKYNIHGNNAIVKFKLDSQLDYSIIESIYQYVFNLKRENSKFSYLEWVPKYNNQIDIKKFDTIKLFDKYIVVKKKVVPGSSEYLQGLLEEFSKINLFHIKKNASLLIEKIIEDCKEFYTPSIVEKSIKKGPEIIKKNSIVKESTISSNSKSSNQTHLIEVETDLISSRLKNLKEINQIGELKGVAKFVGIKNYRNYKKDNLKELKEKIEMKIREQI